MNILAIDNLRLTDDKNRNRFLESTAAQNPEVIVVTGNLHPTQKTIQFLDRIGIPILIMPGVIDLYDVEPISYIKQLVRECNTLDNVTVLFNSSITIQQYCFIGIHHIDFTTAEMSGCELKRLFVTDNQELLPFDYFTSQFMNNDPFSIIESLLGEANNLVISHHLPIGLEYSLGDDLFRELRRSDILGWIHHSDVRGAEHPKLIPSTSVTIHGEIDNALINL